MKIVINTCFGGFSISKECAEWMAARGHQDAKNELNEYEKTRRWYGYFMDEDEKRTDPLLVQAVEELGKQANGDCAALKVVEIPDGITYTIDEYDGVESVEESHQSWS